jgi:hypothetical protein
VVTRPLVVKRPWLRRLGILCLYVVIAAIYTRPLLEVSRSRIAGDPGDPVLVASILWWNATTVPLSEHWWSPPYFYPARDLTAFTENLLGVTPISTPLHWLTRNPFTTYNIVLFLTWPLSAFGAYLLTSRLARREDAAFVTGLVYGFTPYRTAELGHLQMVSCYWMPVALLALHGHLETRRTHWLALFGVAWILQSLSNGYLILFGGVLIVLWLLYFCSTSSAWRAVPGIVVAWGLASLVLLPVLSKYRAVHAHYGLRRGMGEFIEFSAPAKAWFEVTHMVWFWSRILPDLDDNLFPGLTAVVLVIIAGVVAIRRAPTPDSTQFWRALRLVLGVVAGVSLAVILFTAFYGLWHISIAGRSVGLTELDPVIGVAFWSGVPVLALTPSIRQAFSRRSPFLFYVAATLALAILCCGPALRAGDVVILEPMPYRWLLYLPGFNEIRVPTRFWILGVLCLAVASGLAFARFSLPRSQLRAFFTIAVAGILLDGWLRELPMAKAPQPWPKVERWDHRQPILELPMGPGFDAAATFRSIWHRRRVFNGVSGYDPPHYGPLQEAIKTHDPAMLTALASLGSFDIVVDGAADPQGELARYAAGTPGATLVAADGVRTVYRIPAATRQDPPLGAVLRVARARASASDASALMDANIETAWVDYPQHPGQWVSVELESVADVGAITHALGSDANGFPAVLAIDLSLDGVEWHQVWQGTTAPDAFLEAIRQPRNPEMHFAFDPRPARFVRLRQLAARDHVWRIPELKVHAGMKQR